MRKNMCIFFLFPLFLPPSYQHTYHRHQNKNDDNQFILFSRKKHHTCIFNSLFSSVLSIFFPFPFSSNGKIENT